MNRDDFQRLAEVRLSDARALLRAERYSGAYYVAGYAVECALKACIAKRTQQFDFPDRATTNQSYTHNLVTLLRVAELESALSAALANDPTFAANWTFTSDWSEESRYAEPNEVGARSLITAIEDPVHGVLSWLRTRW